MKHKEDDKLTIQCQCGSEYLVLQLQDEVIPGEGLYMCILTRAYDKPSFWHRFRHIWQILRYGKPYTDQMCLSVQDVRKLEKYFSEYLGWIDLAAKHIKKEKPIIITDKELKKINKRMKNEKTSTTK